jgi:serine/threonine-protein kinase
MNDLLLKRWSDIEPLLDQVLELPDDRRADFLDRLPPEQQALRPAIEQLLRTAASAQAAGFLERAASLPMGATASSASGGAEWHAGQLIGPWRLERELGRGGMASVWLARPAQGEFQREVALKLPHSPTPHLADRFRRERDVLARLGHPGIARLFDAGVTPQGLPWLAMERVDGQDLLAWCESRSATVEQRLTLLLQICDALQYAHGRLVIHRDIKPGNVLVQADGQVRLLDFGIARLLDAGATDHTALTQVGQRPMTPEYASPEQVRGEEPGIASDVYALGVLAYRLLAGTSPYAAADTRHRHALEQAILEFQPSPPSQGAQDPAARRALRGDLDTIVLKALAKEPAQRYATVDALAADLRRHLAGVPVLARGPSWRYVAGRFVRRHRLGVSASALAAAGLIGMTAWAWHAADQARQEAQRAQAMYDFVVGLFNPRRSPQPDTRERDMPVGKLIERGAEQVLDSLQDQPQVRERLLADLGTLTQQLGLAPTSQRLSAERVELARKVYGADSVAYADALLGQRDGWEATGQYAVGFEKAREALAIYQARGEHDPLRLARAHMAVGGFGGRLHPAENVDLDHLRQAAALLEPLSGPTPLGTVYEQLLVAHLGRGEMEQAFQAGLAGWKANARQWGPDDWKTAASEDQAGALAAQTLRPAEAERMLRHALDGSRRAMGPDVVLLARGEAVLSMVLFASGRRDEALQHLREAQRITALPANRAQLAFTMTVAATAMELAQRGGDWAALREACAPWGQDVHTPQAALNIRIQQACAASAMHDGALGKAQALLEQGLGIARQAFARTPQRQAVLSLRLGELAMLRGDREAALAAWRDCIQRGDSTTLTWSAQAWSHLRQAQALTAADSQALARFRQMLEQAGGARYYAEYLQLLDAPAS